MTVHTPQHVSHAPALRDAFAPDDLPAHVRYDRHPGPALNLTDANQAPLGDPLREFVADVLERVDENAAPLRLLTAEAHIRPVPAPGRDLDLAALNRPCSEIRTSAAFFSALVRHRMRVNLRIDAVTTAQGDQRLRAWPAVVLSLTQAAPPESIARALADYRSALGTLTAEMIDGPLGPWLVDSGVSTLVLGGWFTVPKPAIHASKSGTTDGRRGEMRRRPSKATPGGRSA